MDEILKVLFSATIAFIYLFLVSKLMGVKQIAEMDFTNYVLGISIGSIAAEMATNLDDKPFYLFIISMTIFFVLDFFINFLGRKFNIIERLFIGSSLIVIENGKILYKNLKKSHMTINELMGLVREKGYFNINDIMYGIREANGQISILPKADASQVTAEDLKVKKPEPSLHSVLVTDGRISQKSLKFLGKDKNWLYRKLGMSKQNIKGIMLATYDENKDKIQIQYKK